MGLIITQFVSIERGSVFPGDRVLAAHGRREFQDSVVTPHIQIWERQSETQIQRDTEVQTASKTYEWRRNCTLT